LLCKKNRKNSKQGACWSLVEKRKKGLKLRYSGHHIRGGACPRKIPKGEGEGKVDECESGREAFKVGKPKRRLT